MGTDPQAAVQRADGQKSVSWQDLPYLLPFLGLFLVQLGHHNLWRDELNAFGIAVASPTLGSLFQHIHYEGHPWLWYFVLWGVSKATVFPWGMKALEAAIGTCTYLMLAVASPFSRREKVLIALGFYVTFEYTVMVRMYGLLLLLALVYIWRRTLHPERTLALGVLLGLMAGTDTMGVLLSLALAAEYGYARLRAGRGQALEGSGRRLLPAAAVYVALLGFAVHSASMAPDISWRTTGHVFAHAREMGHLLEAAENYIVLPYFVGMRRPLKDFWILPAPHPVLFGLGIPLVLAAYWAVFRRHRGLLLMMAVAISGGILFGHLVYHGSQRHFGITFLAFLMGTWVVRTERARLPGAAYVLLGLSAIGGVMTNVGEWRAPFSNAGPTATWLKANHLAEEPLAGTPDTTVSSIAELLHRPVYMLDCDCSDTFLLFSSRRDSFSQEQVPERLARARKNLGVASFVYLQGNSIGPEEARALAAEGLSVTELKSFTGAAVPQEDFFVYRIADAAGRASVRP